MKRIKAYGKHTFSSLSIRNYRLYFIGQAISLSGTWMQMIAQDWLVLKLSNSGTILGLVTALQFLPILLFGPIGGVIADRFPKRKLLYITQISAAILALILGILVVTNTIQLWMMFILAPLLGFINVVDSPTRQTFVFEMVGKEQITNAVALTSTEVNLARVIGPSIAGLLISTVGLAPCFIINAISYIPVLYMLYIMNAREFHVPSLAPREKGQLKKGLIYVWHTPMLRDTLIMMAIIGTLTYEFTVTLPLLSQFVFHKSAGGYAALTAAMGIGSVIGGLITAGRKQLAPVVLIRSALLFGITILIAAIIPNLFLELVVMFFIGIFSITFIALGNTTLQLESKPEMRGRVMALWTMAFLGSTPIGGPIVGWISEHSGAQWGLAVGGFAAFIAAGIGFYGLKKEKKQLVPEEVNQNCDENMRATGIKF